MAKNSLNILSLLGSNKEGGAENFFDRLILSLNKKEEINIHTVIRKNKKRYKSFKDNNISVEEINFYNYLNFFTYRNLQNICRKFSPNIIFSMMNRASSMMAGLSNVNAIKVGRLGGYYNLKYYVYCDYLVANTPDIKEYIISEGWDKNKVVYLPNFACKSNLKNKIKNKKKNNFILLGVGRFHENKNFEILVKSLKYLDNCSLWLVGKGELKKKYLEIAKKDNTIAKLKIFDWTDQIKRFYHNADILVCPSKIEPLGNIILEGWLNKIPIVSSDAKGPDFLIKHGINGLKFQNGNLNELVTCLRKLLKNFEKSKILTKNGYSSYLKGFSEKLVLEKYLNFFKKVVY